MLVIGHRGAAGIARENTLEALRAGLEAGADILEFDVRLTKDKVPVILHDFHTLRTHLSPSIVSHHSFKDLQERIREHGSIILLTDVLDEFFGVILLNIELKGRGTAKVVTELLKRYVKKPGDWDNVLISSFRGSELSTVRSISRRANLALLHSENPFLFIAYHRKLQLSAVGFHRLYINKFALEIAKRAGLFVYAYTVNRPHTALMLAQQDIDGIVTDNPGTILSEIKKHAS